MDPKMGPKESGFNGTMISVVSVWFGVVEFSKNKGGDVVDHHVGFVGTQCGIYTRGINFKGITIHNCEPFRRQV